MVHRLAPPLVEPLAPGELLAWVREYMGQERLCAPGERLLVAVSGGPDSVALLHLLVRLHPELGVTVGVAHFHHGLREEAADADALFVAALARDLRLPCHQGRGDTAAHARERRISVQMAARELRRAFLERTCREEGYDKVALGHTADDQVELFFLRLLRGAGLTGLKGMWPASPAGVIRPLLAVGKNVLLAWLAQEGLAYREDVSNLSPAYLRNRVRQELLPFLEERFNPRLRQGIWRLMARLQEEERFLRAETAAAWERLVRRPLPDLLVLGTRDLLALPAALQARLLQQAVAAVGGGRLLESHRHGLLALAQARQSGGLLALCGCTVARAGGELHLFPPLPPATPWEAVLPGPGVVDTPPGWRWEARLLPEALAGPLPPGTVLLDARAVGFPLELRTPRPGDRFRPPGAPGARKVKEVFIDGRIPRWLRPHLPVVASQGRLVWVAGLGAAHPGAARRGPALSLSLTPTTPVTLRLWRYIALFARPPAGSPEAATGKDMPAGP